MKLDWRWEMETLREIMWDDAPVRWIVIVWATLFLVLVFTGLMDWRYFFIGIGGGIVGGVLTLLLRRG